MSLDPAELARLHKFVGAHREKFALALVRVPQLDVREDLREWAASVAGELGRGLVVIDGKGRTWREVWDQIAAGSQPGDVVVLTGLDELLRAEGGDLAKLLNRQRETIGQLLPGPVLWLIGDLALDRLLVTAPDLADWYAASFEFGREVFVEDESTSELARNDQPAFSIGFSQDRIKLLEMQLQNRGLGTRVRALIQLQLARLYQDLGNSGLSQTGATDATSFVRAKALATEAASLLAASRDSDETDDELPKALMLEGSLLSDLGRHAESKEKIETAVRLYRRLNAASDMHLAGLAAALLNYAVCLMEVGETGGALSASSEALDVYKRLAKADPAAFGSLLAMSLNNHSNILRQTGDIRGALELQRNALAMRREQAVAAPAKSSVDLAKSLNNYAIMLAETGDIEASVTAASEGIAILRRLSSQLASPELATLLVTLANRLKDLGRLQEAIVAASEAVSIRRRLASLSPTRFSMQLATALGLLGSITPDPETAAGLFKEALEHLRADFLAQPQRFEALVSGLGGHYLQQCKLAGLPPDYELLQSLAKVLEEVTTQSPPPAADDHSPT